MAEDSPESELATDNNTSILNNLREKIYAISWFYYRYIRRQTGVTLACRSWKEFLKLD